MPRAKRICSTPGCPNPAVTTRCQQHEREHDKARGTKAERGYDAGYYHERKAWAARIKQGGVRCWRPQCQRPINHGDRWHLGHDDHDRAIIRGPECVHCNLSAAGKASHRFD